VSKILQPNITPADFVKKVLNRDLYAWQDQLFSMVDVAHKRSEDLLRDALSLRVLAPRQSTHAFVLKARKLCHGAAGACKSTVVIDELRDYLDNLPSAESGS